MGLIKDHLTLQFYSINYVWIAHVYCLLLLMNCLKFRIFLFPDSSDSDYSHIYGRLPIPTRGLRKFPTKPLFLSQWEWDGISLRVSTRVSVLDFPTYLCSRQFLVKNILFCSILWRIEISYKIVWGLTQASKESV